MSAKNFRWNQRRSTLLLLLLLLSVALFSTLCHAIEIEVDPSYTDDDDMETYLDESLDPLRKQQYQTSAWNGFKTFASSLVENLPLKELPMSIYNSILKPLWEYLTKPRQSQNQQPQKNIYVASSGPNYTAMFSFLLLCAILCLLFYCMPLLLRCCLLPLNCCLGPLRSIFNAIGNGSSSSGRRVTVL